MKRRRQAVRIAGIVAAVLLLAGGAAALTVRGDWRYRVLYVLTPAEAEVLRPVEADRNSREWTVAELEADARVTVRNTLRLVNPEHPLEKEYEPALVAFGDWQMTDETREAFERLRVRVEAETGERLLIRSAYRSRDEQRTELNAEGESVAARPGESEHETGLALDLCVRGYGGQAFLKTAAGRLVNRSCAEEGFVIRYPIGRAQVTGFGFEPWHVRYVGSVHAGAMQEGRLTLEEYIGGMVPEQWYEYDGYRIVRSREETVSLPQDFAECSISEDGCGYRIFTVKI